MEIVVWRNAVDALCFSVFLATIHCSEREEKGGKKGMRSFINQSASRAVTRQQLVPIDCKLYSSYQHWM